MSVQRILIPIFGVEDLITVPRVFRDAAGEKRDEFESGLVRLWRKNHDDIEVTRNARSVMDPKFFTDGTIPVVVLTTGCPMGQGGFELLATSAVHLRLILGFTGPIVVVTFVAGQPGSADTQEHKWPVDGVHQLLAEWDIEADLKFILDKLPR